MPIYSTEEACTEDLRIRITPTMRQWLETKARTERRTLNSVARNLIDDAMHAKTPPGLRDVHGRGPIDGN